jgi:uncharacterized protein
MAMLSFYQLTVPVFLHGLDNLSGILKKAEAFADARKIAPAVMCGLRPTVTVMPLSRHVAAACDSAKLAVSRLSGVVAPRYADDEKDFLELQTRIANTVDYIETVPASAIDERLQAIAIDLDGRPREFDRATYLTLFALPNFHFHSTVAYTILRTNGVELIKQDYEGALPG